MLMIYRRSLVKKAVNILLIYILLLDTMIPSLYAIQTLSAPDFSYRTIYTIIPAKTTAIPNVEQTDGVVKEDWKPTNERSDEQTFNQVVNSFSAVTASLAAQPEVSGFSIGSTDEMVDKFTGDFSYSIPLVDAEGYPIVLAYNSNISMLDEASWVGLGWNLNVGAISRDMRGIPDDFNGEDIVKRQFNQQDIGTEGSKNGGYTSISVGGESGGLGIGISFLAGKYTDNYLGIGKTYDLNIGGSARYSVQSDGESNGLFLSPSINLGLSYDSKNGVGSTFGFGLNAGYDNNANSSKSGGVTYQRSKHSRHGLMSQSVTLGISNQKYQKGENAEGENIGGGLSRSSFSSTSSFSYGTATLAPKVNFNSTTSSKNFEMDVYVGMNLTAVKMRLGYLHQDYNTSSKMLYHSLQDQTINQPAYGYFHSGKRKSYSGGYFPIMDFNRGVENEYSEEMAMLPFSVQTHDVFYVNGGGINGTFRGMRSDYGTYYDPNSESVYNNDSKLFSNDNVTTVATGAVFSLPLTIGFGIAYSTGTMKGEQASGNWKEYNNLLEFTAQVPSEKFDESVYFKPMGNVAPVDMGAWNEVNGNTPDYFDVNVSGGQMEQDNFLKYKTSGVTLMNSHHEQTYSDIYFHPRTAGEMHSAGFIDYQSTPSTGAVTDIFRIDADRKGNHISAVDVVTPNGVKYQYGIPVYTYQQQEVTFSCEGLLELNENTIPSGMIKYNNDNNIDNQGDNSIGNDLAIQNYFDKTTIPAYAQGFLLTQVTSSDYVDLTNNGLTIDDVGNYYKFKHTRVYGDKTTDNTYGTRFPISGTSTSDKRAFYGKGALGSSRDDLANYTYQEGEVWYTQSLETKNLIVEFHLENRKDAYSANEDGILDHNKPMKCLKEIRVYNRLEKRINQNAVPLQTVRFEYDYSLCQNAPGNLNTYTPSSGQSGKLTLKGIRIFNGDSYENALSSISFDYASGADNPPFSYANIDAWGLNKPNSAVKPNDLYPYADQSMAAADQAARAWKLIGINNPMGGRIEIDYESDSYGYVQDRRAMRNFDVHRMTDLFDFMKIRKDGNWNGLQRGNGATMRKEFHHKYTNVQTLLSENGVAPAMGSIISKAIFEKNPNALYNILFGQFDINLVPNNVIIFKLETPLVFGAPDQAFADQRIADLYFRDTNNPSKGVLTELYAKMYVEIKPGVFDLVPTMSTIAQKSSANLFNGYFLPYLSEQFPPYGAMPPNANGEYEYGYVIVDPVHTGTREEKGVDQLKKGSIAIHPMQLTALEYARAALPDKVYGSDPDSEGDLSIDWKVFFGHDMYKYMIQGEEGKYYCNFFDNADGEVGVSRSVMRLNEPDYTKFGGGARVKEIRYFDNWREISGEYDSQYSWKYKYTTTINERIEYTNGVAAFEPMSIIDESPFNKWHTYVNIKKKFPDENRFIPGPVDYQLYPKPVVGYEKVEVTFKEAALIEAGNYGKSVTKYYTAKDYPTVSGHTTIDKSAKIQKSNIVTGNTRDIYGITQGYVTETNDFHGKIRLAEVTKKGEENEDVTISKTVYTYYGKGERLRMADRSGKIGLYNAAIEYDIHADSKFATDETRFFQMGLDFVLYWTPPIFFTPSFSPIFAMSSRERSFYSHTLVKHINYSAVLKDVTTEYLRSINTARTNVFDMYTGAPVVSELTDEYNDRLYQVNYPAHWKYKELRELHGINGTGVLINLALDGRFIPSPTNNSDRLSPGDIVLMDGNTLQVAQEWPWPENGELFFMTPTDGSIYIPNTAGSKTVTILVSHRDNRLLETMQGFTTKVNPVTGVYIEYPKDHILSASAITYRDRLTSNCFCNDLSAGEQYNPYRLGMRGDLVLDKQFAWQSERSNYEDPHGIRFDGAYRSNNSGEPNFILFYEGDGNGKWNPIASSEHSQHVAANKYRNWRPMGNSTLYDQFANPVEAKDQINVHSAVLTGYGSTFNSLVMAQAVNAQRRQIAFDGFEDYNAVLGSDHRCRITAAGNTHFDFFHVAQDTESGVRVDKTTRHSGLASLRVDPLKTAAVTRNISPTATCYPDESTDVLVGKGIGMDLCGCLPTFSPTPGKYIIGAWVNGTANTTSIQVKIVGGLTYNFPPQDLELDGWKRIEGEFEIPAAGSEIVVSLINNNTGIPAYFDDLRIHPFLAGMQTTVYDPATFLPLATHDGYNFTTFYNYDENLNLVRIRVETEEGIKTIMEQESGGQKTYLSE